MAEYCSKCKVLPIADHSLFFIGLRLKRGQSEHFICEGCNIRGLKRDDRGKLYLLRDVDGFEVQKRTFLFLLIF